MKRGASSDVAFPSDIGGEMMGTKFANLHIKTTDQEAVADALQKLSNIAGSMLADTAFSGLDIIDQYIYRTTNANVSGRTASTATFYVRYAKPWCSVLNDYFQSGTIEKVGEIVSTLVSEPVMTIGFFDEDLFEFTIFQDGEIKAKKYFCEEWVKAEYDLESEVIDLAYVEEVLEINREQSIPFVQISDPEQAIVELSQLVHIDLWVHSEWISEDKEMEEKYSKLVVTFS